MTEDTLLHGQCMNLLLQAILNGDLRFASFACLSCVLFAYPHLKERDPGVGRAIVDAVEDGGCPTCGTPGFILPRYAHLVIRIELDWCADDVLRTARAALEASGVAEEEMAEFAEHARGADYDSLLQLVSRWMWFLMEKQG